MSEEHKNIVHSDMLKVERFLDDYEVKIGIKNLQESEVSQYLHMNQDMLRKLSPEECAEIAYLLNQEALFVQHEINKYTAQASWAKQRIDKTVASKIAEYGTKYTPFEFKRILAIKDNTYAVELQAIADKAERIINRISYVPNHLKNLASVLLDYRHTKLNSMREQRNEATRPN